MRVSQLGAAAALAAVSQGFLLPPTITSSDIQIGKPLPIPALADNKIMWIDCPGCPVVITNLLGQSKPAAANLMSRLQLNFTLGQGEPERLMVNDHQIFPFQTDDPNPLVADQLVKSPAGTWDYVASPELGFGVGTDFPGSSNQEELQLVTIRLQILEVAGIFIGGIWPTVEVQLLQTPSGKLMIADAHVAETSDGLFEAKLFGAHKPLKPTECTDIICEWRAVITDKISKMRGGCGGKRPSNTVDEIKPGHGAYPAKPHHTHGGHRPHGPHGPHGHFRHRHGRFARLIRTIVFHVVIPIMIGVVVGITASLVGMIVGHTLVFIWRVLFRRGERAQRCRFQEEATLKSDDDETKGFLEKENAPPVYEDVPAYEEAVVEKV